MQEAVLTGYISSVPCDLRLVLAFAACFRLFCASADERGEDPAPDAVDDDIRFARKRGLAQRVFHVLTVGEGHARLAQCADRLPVALQGGWGACP